MNAMSLNLNAAEQLTLQEAAQNHPLAFFRERALALLQLAAGQPAADPAAHNWAGWYAECGLAGLYRDQR
jgi:hypothetical protein